MTDTAHSGLDHVTGLVCVVCGKAYPVETAGYDCTDHGNEGILDVRYDYELVGAHITKQTLAADPDPTMWRYRAVMPVAHDAEVPPLTVGGTPTYDAPRLAADLGIASVWVKDEGRQPTASLKDRASAMAVVKGREAGADVITTASTGNAAAALSGMCASVGQRNVIFVVRSRHPKPKWRNCWPTGQPWRSSPVPTRTLSSCAWRPVRPTGGTTATRVTTRT